MTSIRIYEAALCCDTGVCGVDVDQALVTLTADVRHLQEAGIDIRRHNLASEPEAFTADETVRGFLHTVGSSGLPLTVVDGVTVATGSYPSREFLLKVAGGAGATPAAPRPDLGLSATASASAACCGGTGCC
jgi:arsenite-transporting ATPase